MPGTYSKVKTVTTGDIISATDRNAEHDNHINHCDFAGLGGYSSNTAQMQSTADPYPASVESLATDGKGELERLRYVIAQLSGKTYWYQDPASSIETIVNGSQVFSGSKTFSSQISITAITNHLLLATSSFSAIITVAAIATQNRGYTIPDISGNGTFALLEGTQTFSGSKTFSAQILVSATTNQFLLSTAGGGNVQITTASHSISRTYTIPDAGGTSSFVMTDAAQTINGVKTFTSGIVAAAGTVSVMGVGVGNNSKGLYEISTNVVGLALNGVKAASFTSAGTADDTQYLPLQIFGGAGTNVCAFTLYSTTTVTTAKTIAAVDTDAYLLMVLGSDGAGNRFVDIVLATNDNTTPSVILSKTSAGSPAARTYTGATGLAKVAMASGTYTIRTMGFGGVFR